MSEETTPTAASTTPRRRSGRLDVRMTPEARALIDRAVQALDTDLTQFVNSTLADAAERVLADRIAFPLPEDEVSAWEEVNNREPRELPRMRVLLYRPTPFTPDAG